jgi:hypothetical protein
MASVAVAVSVECQDYFLPSTGVLDRENLSIGTSLGCKRFSLSVDWGVGRVSLSGDWGVGRGEIQYRDFSGV